MKHGGNVWAAGEPGQWLDFSANLRPEGMAPWVRETMRTAADDAAYYPDPSMRAARRGLAAYAGVPEKCILPTPGGAAAIDLALSLGRGRVRIDMPTFGEYAERARVHGREVAVSGPLTPGDTAVLCNPNNPTGEALTREQVLARHRKAAQDGAELLVDEAFIDYCPERSVRRDIAPGLMVAGSLTKILGAPGLRLGYVCAVPAVIERLAARQLPWALGAMASAVAAALPLHVTDMAEDAARNELRRERFASALTRRGVRGWPSAAPFLLADFGRDMTRTAAELRRRGILVRTCASFGLPPSVLRLAVKTDEQNQRLMEALWPIF